MGANLYIRTIHEALCEKYRPLLNEAIRKRDSLPQDSKEAAEAQEEVERYFRLMRSEGYFRDPYKISSMLATLELTWWGDVASLCNERGELKGESLKRFREMVAGAKQHLPSKKEFGKDHGQVNHNGNGLSEWHKHFIDKRMKLLAFLDHAIELDTAIDCSL